MVNTKSPLTNSSTAISPRSDRMRVPARKHAGDTSKTNPASLNGIVEYTNDDVVLKVESMVELPNTADGVSVLVNEKPVSEFPAASSAVVVVHSMPKPSVGPPCVTDACQPIGEDGGVVGVVVRKSCGGKS